MYKLHTARMYTLLLFQPEIHRWIPDKMADAFFVAKCMVPILFVWAGTKCIRDVPTVVGSGRPQPPLK